MAKIYDMGQTALLPFRRKVCWGFFRPEKSDGFGRVWTRELGHQRPAHVIMLVIFLLISGVTFIYTVFVFFNVFRRRWHGDRRLNSHTPESHSDGTDSHSCKTWAVLEYSFIFLIPSSEIPVWWYEVNHGYLYLLDHWEIVVYFVSQRIIVK